jgi:hypothetical protein
MLLSEISCSVMASAVSACSAVEEPVCVCVCVCVYRFSFGLQLMPY